MLHVTTTHKYYSIKSMEFDFGLHKEVSSLVDKHYT